MQNLIINIRVFLILVILFISQNSLACPQLPDYVIYKGDTIPTYNLILEKYFQKIKKPDNGSLFGLKFREVSTFKCWRGYQAIYAIENDSLFLKNIIRCGARRVDQAVSDKRITEIFGNKHIKGKVFLDWYSGEFSIPNGKLLRWDEVFYKIFEKEILFKVKNGKIRKISKIDNYVDDSKRINRKYRDTISNVLINELSKQNWDNKKKFYCSEIYLVTIAKNGKVRKVIMPEFKTEKEINEFFGKGEYEYCLKKVYKVLKKLKFDIIKDKGKPIEETIIIDFFY